MIEIKNINKIENVIVAMAYGDSMGMPSELWSRKKVKEYFGEINELLDGPAENEVACNYSRGEFTDDTSQALVILDTLIADDFEINKKHIAENLVTWAKKEKAWENNILGPTSKISLAAHINGEDVYDKIKNSHSNGAAMRIAPIGTLFKPSQRNQLVEYVCKISSVTHISDICFAGACMVAMGVSSALESETFDQVLEDIYQVEQMALKKGVESFNPLISERVKFGLQEIEKMNTEEEVLSFIYNVIGCGVGTSESVSSALILSAYANDVKHCAKLCANIGGDTDTIGAMACAIVGAFYGTESMGSDFETIVKINNIDLNLYHEQIAKVRGSL